jgi:hypothetical protein
MTANHYWTKAGDRGEFHLSEQATSRGLAFNARSLAQASMGIAAGDADQDGDVDLFLTHFSNDHNTFYEQTAAGVWADHSHRSGLAEPSLPTLGYGTQWIDLNNDGTLELMVANGDIDDFSHQGRSFRQPPQLFRRHPDGRWLPVVGDSVGGYFQSTRLGRAVAHLDANRDERTDLIVTHLFDPVALLINDTPSAGRRTRFVLRGVAAHRDGVGAVVRCVANGRRHVGQLFAGHGYQCSNEACVSFGVGAASELKEVVVTWPDGSEDRLGSLPTGTDYLVVQGQRSAFAIGGRKEIAGRNKHIEATR